MFSINYFKKLLNYRTIRRTVASPGNYIIVTTTDNNNNIKKRNKRWKRNVIVIIIGRIDISFVQRLIFVW